MADDANDLGLSKGDEDVGLINQAQLEARRQRMEAYHAAKHHAKESAMHAYTTTTHHARASYHSAMKHATSIYSKLSSGMSSIKNWAVDVGRSAANTAKSMLTMKAAQDAHLPTLKEKFDHAKRKLSTKAQQAIGATPFLSDLITGTKLGVSAVSAKLHEVSATACKSIADHLSKHAEHQTHHMHDAMASHREAKEDARVLAAQTKATQLEVAHRYASHIHKHLTDVAAKHDKEGEVTEHGQQPVVEEHHHVVPAAKTFAKKLRHRVATKVKTGVGAEPPTSSFPTDHLDDVDVSDLSIGNLPPPTLEGSMPLPNTHELYASGLPHHCIQSIVDFGDTALYAGHHGHMIEALLNTKALMNLIEAFLTIALSLMHAKFAFIAKHGMELVIHRALNTEQAYGTTQSMHSHPTHTAYDYIPKTMPPHVHHHHPSSVGATHGKATPVPYAALMPPSQTTPTAMPSTYRPNPYLKGARF